MSYKINYDKECCIGCGACIQECPDNWIWEEEFVKVVPNKTEIEDDEFEANDKAASVCGSECIKIKKI